MKFPIENGMVVVRANQKVARQCLVAAINHEIKQKEQFETMQLLQLQGPKGLARVNSVEELVRIQILPHTDRYFQIGKSLQIEDRVEILLSLV